ncbi:MAG TPA: hypothetical protein VJL84_01050 [Kiloniellales bacterium]|nr:hypothetical protein [Kiloniellales bacterium]
MTKRHAVRATTVQAVAADYAGRPQSDESAAAFAQFLEANQRQLEALRRLSLKGAEPAMVFRPLESKHHG